MEDSVIFNTPALLILFGAALVLAAAGLIKRTGYILPALSAAVAAAASTYALLLGAEMREVLVFILLLLAIHLTAFASGRQKK